MPDLPDKQKTGLQIFRMVERARIKTVIVEKMNRRPFLGKEIQNSDVQIQFPKNPDRVHVRDRDDALFPNAHGRIIFLLAFRFKRFNQLFGFVVKGKFSEPVRAQLSRRVGGK